MAEALTLPPATNASARTTTAVGFHDPGTAVGSYLTSTAVGHPDPGTPPQPAQIQWRCMKDLPVGVSVGAKCRPVTLGDVYNTTTARVHRDHRRNMTTPTSRPQHKMAPSHWKVHYTKYITDKCEDQSWYPALTMGNQESEMKRNFQGKLDSIVRRLPDSTQGQPLPHTLKHHLDNQLTKALPAATVNPAVEGRALTTSEGGVLNRLEPYLTTNQQNHRYFTPQELAGYPSNDIATYWQCEDYPKAMGFGMHYNPLEREPRENTEQEKPSVMRDRIQFPKATKLPPVQTKSAKPVSNGLQTLHCDMYKWPAESKTRQLFYCPVPPGPSAAVTKDRTQLEAVSHMYKSMNSSYGNPPTRP